MRMRKKPWARDMIQSREDCVIASPEELKGTWKSLGYEHVIVEIGAGKGDYWINMGNMHPEELWVAVEKSVDAAGIALKKSIDRTKAGEVERIHLNFSDPWPKKHHTKRRLTYSSFLNDYRSILMPGGKIVMKTDNSKLFEFSLVSFAENGWLLREAYVNYRETAHDEDAITEYESNFIALNQPIYRAVWEVVK